jgi:hypothetical protein
MVVRVGERFFSLHLIVGHQSKKSFRIFPAFGRLPAAGWLAGLRPAVPPPRERKISRNMNLLSGKCNAGMDSSGSEALRDLGKNSCFLRICIDPPDAAV